jgi:hypothetical protein
MLAALADNLQGAMSSIVIQVVDVDVEGFADPQPVERQQ